MIENIIKEVEEKAIIVGLDTGMYLNYDAKMEELKSLCEALNIKVVEKTVQSAPNPNPATFIGSGKLIEISEDADRLEATHIVFQDTLSPTQLKNIQKETDCTVWDRTNLILEIFNKRAKTREARLQVESANLQYMLPRLVGLRTKLGRQGGASGSLSNKGSGEKQIELDKRKIEHRISELRNELELIEHDRNVQRKRREKSDIPLVALVGYTNAGKSTLMNHLLENFGEFTDEKLSEKQVEEKNMLFATLDTTVRKIEPKKGRALLVSDTVGFIEDLPHGLVKAFRSTLDETKYADLIIEVVDAHDEHADNQRKVTEETLKELGADDIPRIIVMNKSDLCNMENLPLIKGNKIFMSAKSEIGLNELVEMILETTYGKSVTKDYLFPYNESGELAKLESVSTVISRDFVESGVKIRLECAEKTAEKYVRFTNNIL